MNAYLNYLLEANLGLGIFLIVYYLLLSRETDFKTKRMYVLMSIGVSLLFPLLHFRQSAAVPSLSTIIPPTWLPEFTVTAGGRAPLPAAKVPVWGIVYKLYLAGVTAFLILFIVRLASLLKKMRWAATYPCGSYRVVESNENRSSFSFFSFIFIGRADMLSENDKQQIIRHEGIHASQFHSIDILIIHVLGILFWFNPLLRTYKKIFIQLHEFEADARAVGNSDADDYCNLMARVALLSADIKLANHFSNSLTLKRIEMIRTIKTRIVRWKFAAIGLMFSAFSIMVACQDQITNELTDIARNSSMSLDYPDEVRQKVDELKKEYPDHKFVVLEPNDKATDLYDAVQEKLKGIDPAHISLAYVMKGIKDEHGQIRSFIIVDYNDQAKAIANNAVVSAAVFTIVEESATMPGGIEALGKFLSENIRYPRAAREQGKEGTVFVEFIVNKDGSLSDFKVMKSVDASLDREALRVVALMPNWTPARQQGEVVRQRFVLPISFRLNSGPEKSVTEPSAVDEPLRVTSEVSVGNSGKKVITGRVSDLSDNPLPGANVVLSGSTTGAVTNMDGRFRIEAPENSGTLWVSFVGYKSQQISF